MFICVRHSLRREQGALPIRTFRRVLLPPLGHTLCFLLYILFKQHLGTHFGALSARHTCSLVRYLAAVGSLRLVWARDTARLECWSAPLDPHVSGGPSELGRRRAMGSGWSTLHNRHRLLARTHQKYQCTRPQKQNRRAPSAWPQQRANERARAFFIPFLGFPWHCQCQMDSSSMDPKATVAQFGFQSRGLLSVAHMSTFVSECVCVRACARARKWGELSC